MSRRLGIVLVFALVFPFILTGCSDETTAPAGGPGGNPGVVQGNIDPNATEFEFTTAVACRPGDPSGGYFMIRGTNIHYDSLLTALVADLTVTNMSRCSHPEPVWMIFVNLLPPGVTVLNPDNGEHGPGAAVMFDFENDDGMWTPLEMSLPRTVQFGVGAGQGIGFVARIEVGTEPDLGTIAGVVFEDINENGVMDDGEPGLAGHPVSMVCTDGPEILWHTMSGEGGAYAFEGLHQGHYVVTKDPIFCCAPTTPATIQVLLVETDGEVSDFMDAHFGCAPMTMPLKIEVGDGVKVSGVYGSRPGAITAVVIDVYKCPPFGGTGDVEPPCVRPFDELMGPVIDINKEERLLSVMGAWVWFDTIPNDSTMWADNQRCCPPIEFEDVEIGDRVRTRVETTTFADGPFIGVGLWAWPYKEDRVHGVVEQVVIMPPPGYPSEIMVLKVPVIITQLTRINFH